MFEDIKRIKAKNKISITFESGSGDLLELKIYLLRKTEAYIAKTPGNPADRKRNTILLLSKGDSTAFRVSYQITTIKEN